MYRSTCVLVGNQTRPVGQRPEVTPFLDAVRGDDLIGVQTYTRTTLRKDGSHSPDPGHPLTVMGYEDRPEALVEVCRYIWKETGTPVLVTENGASGGDARRAAFIRQSLQSLHAAIADRVEVLGYCYWSLLDKYEWMSDYGPKFGLIRVNRKTQKRRIKPSVLAYGDIARANGFLSRDQTEAGAILHPPRSGTPLGTG